MEDDHIFIQNLISVELSFQYKPSKMNGYTFKYKIFEKI